MLNCPRCNEKMVWQSDYDCEDYGCECGDGIVSFYTCDDCNVEMMLTTDCKHDKEEDN